MFLAPQIDGLETAAGVPRDKVVQCHGDLFAAHCSICQMDATEGQINRAFEDTPPAGSAAQPQQQARAPMCPKCGQVMRPNVVFFGEPLPSRFHMLQNEDMERCNLLIVLGTTLRVYPFAGLVNQVPLLTPRLLINRELVGPFRVSEVEHQNAYRDVSFVGACDDGASVLMRALRWGE